MTISVAMCTYNGAKFLREELESLAEQLVLPDELVVCDDASSDDTVAVLQRFADAACFPVRIHVNPHNLGYVRNFEQAISLCRSDLIALCDQDDVWAPDKLAKSASLLAELPDTGLVCTDADIVGPNLEPLGVRLSQTLGFGAPEKAAVAQGDVLAVLVRINFATGATMMFRSSLRAAVLPIPEGWVHDAWIALMVSLIAGIAFLDEPLVRYRQHLANQIGAPRATGLRDLVTPAAAGHGFVQDAERWRVAWMRAQPVASETNLAMLAEKAHHARLRAQLPTRRLPRVPSIIRELLRHNYHRYSAGARSALKDLVGPR